MNSVPFLSQAGAWLREHTQRSEGGGGESEQNNQFFLCKYKALSKMVFTPWFIISAITPKKCQI